MHTSPLLTLFLLATSAAAQPFNWQWSVATTADLSTPDVMGMATDALGNSYVSGQFYGTTSFGSLPALTSAGQSDVFVVKYDNQGVPLWSVRGGGSDFDGVYDLAIDGLGNVFITGWFQSPTCAFGSTNLALQGGMDIHVVKLSANDGAILWAKRFGGSGNSSNTEMGKAIACDTQGNVYVSGHFRSTLDVPGLTTLQSCSQYYNAFLIKLDTDGNGVWSRRPDCGQQWSYSASEGQRITVGPAGDLYAGYRIRGDTIFYETDTLLNDQASGQAHDGVVAKYDLNGNYQWSRVIGGYGYDDVQGLAANADGTCYIAMHREGEYSSLGLPGIAVAGSLGTYRNVILKITADGNFLWGTRIGNSTYDHDIEVLRLESPQTLLVGGWHQGNFEIGGVTPNPGVGGSYGIYLARFDSSSAMTDLYASRYTYPRGIRGLGLDEGGNIYVGGYFQDSLSLPGLPVMDVETNAMFVARSGDFNTSIPDARFTSTVRTYPSPSAGAFVVESELPFTGLRIVDVNGREVVREEFAPTQKHELELQGPGLYLCRLLHVDGEIASARVLITR